MARSKAWTHEDREAALSWIERKAKTGAVFRNQDDAADDMLPALADITDLEDFSEAVQSALTTSAWKRLLGALRQRKHQAGDEDQDEGPQTDQGQACQSCARLQDEVDRLQRLIDALQAPGTQTDAARHQTEVGAYRAAALALTRSAIASGTPEGTAARVVAGKLRDIQRHRGEDQTIGAAHVQRWMDATEVQVITSDIRDRAVIVMHQAGESKRGIARALGISDGTVRNVINRLHQ